MRKQKATPVPAQVPKKAPRSFTKPVKTPSYDEHTAERIRAALEGKGELVEKKMFGGLCFMVDDRMCCGLTKTSLMVRVGKEAHAAALREPHARPMDFTGRPLSGFVFVDPEGYATAAALKKWIGRALAFVNGPAVETRAPRKARS